MIICISALRMASASSGHDMSRKIDEKGNDKIFKSFFKL